MQNIMEGWQNVVFYTSIHSQRDSVCPWNVNRLVAMEPQGECDRLFEDSDFPAEDSSVFSSDFTPISKLQGHINWLRPQVIVRGIIQHYQT